MSISFCLGQISKANGLKYNTKSQSNQNSFWKIFSWNNIFPTYASTSADTTMLPVDLLSLFNFLLNISNFSSLVLMYNKI